MHILFTCMQICVVADVEKVKKIENSAALVINRESENVMVPCLLNEMLLDTDSSASFRGSKKDRKREGVGTVGD